MTDCPGELRSSGRLPLEVAGAGVPADPPGCSGLICEVGDVRGARGTMAGLETGLAGTGGSAGTAGTMGGASCFAGGAGWAFSASGGRGAGGGMTGSDCCGGLGFAAGRGDAGCGDRVGGCVWGFGAVLDALTGVWPGEGTRGSCCADRVAGSLSGLALVAGILIFGEVGEVADVVLGGTVGSSVLSTDFSAGATGG